MESPPLARYIPQKSKKRVFSGSSSSFMEPEVVEIPPPISRTSNSSLKQKGVIHQEIIEIDMDEDSADVMVIDEKVDNSNKGKEVLANYLFGPTNAANLGSVDGVQPFKSFAPGSHNSLNLDGFNSDLSYDDDEYIDIYYDDIMYDDDYAILQAHFDNVDIPPGVEAPIPWLPDPAQNKKEPATATNSPYSNLQTQSDAVGLLHGTDPSHNWWLPEPAQIRKKSTSISSSSLQAQLDSVSHPHGVEPSSSWLFPEPSKSKKKPAALTSSTQSSSQTQRGAVNLPPGVELSNSWRLLEPFHSKKKPAASRSSNHYSWHNQLDARKLPPGVEPSLWGPYIPNSTKKQVGTSTLNYSYTQKDTMNLPPGVDPSISWWQDSSGFKKKPYSISDPAYSSFPDPFDAVHILPEEEAYIPWVHDPAQSQKNASVAGSSTIPFESINHRENDGNEDDILKKFQLFKQFDTVQDHSDHRHTGNGSSLKQPPKIWAKKIQDEWKILEKDLPDTIFVRIYESRMDLLRAVIVGAEGTPYHDGLFFFDVFFPCGYPNVPPHVHYHSGGLRLNPNLYESGKVCLSLLNTWSGNQNEKWIPGVSTMLQVLVSIQGLILNAKPFFNEPGFASMSGSASGEKRSQQYNETTFILSLKTMLYTMRKPPKHFEDFVVGHFCKRAHDILVACKAYMDGAQVGCLVKGGVQDVDEGDKSCSEKFKGTVADYVNKLVRAFTQIGAKDCEKFLSPAEKGNRRGGSTPKASNI